jgi:hypothetical protein
MQHTGELVGAVQVALQRVRGEFAALERAVRDLTDAMDEKAAPIDLPAIITEPIRDAQQKVDDGLSWDEITHVLARELWLPEFGAPLPPDEQA